MKKQVTAIMQFTMYVLPCFYVGGPLVPRPTGAREKLINLINRGKSPSRVLLHKCVPEAVQNFGKFAGIDPVHGKRWSLPKVQEFWRQHKGWGPACRVKKGKVLKTNCIRVYVRFEGRDLWWLDKFALLSEAKPGDTVYSHHKFVTEWLPSS